jgi:HD-GYP domain-containing protein (c-di-GMP phosphodiesterase class II)
MHDIGKIGIPAAIIDKAERLTVDEFDVIKRHPEIGEQILNAVPAFRDILCIVRSHHERLDGRGYPDGLAGDAIPFLARIVAVADVYDAMASDRPYRRGLSPREVVSAITKDRLTHFDPVVVAALHRLERAGELDEMGGLVQSAPDESDFIMGPPSARENARGAAPATDNAPAPAPGPARCGPTTRRTIAG